MTERDEKMQEEPKLPEQGQEGPGQEGKGLDDFIERWKKEWGDQCTPEQMKAVEAVCKGVKDMFPKQEQKETDGPKLEGDQNKPEGWKQPKEPKEGEAPERKPINLSITLDPNGKLGVNGPLENKILCLGLLEAAKDVVKSYQSSRIIRPPLAGAGLPPGMKFPVHRS